MYRGIVENTPFIIRDSKVISGSHRMDSCSATTGSSKDRGNRTVRILDLAFGSKHEFKLNTECDRKRVGFTRGNIGLFLLSEIERARTHSHQYDQFREYWMLPVSYTHLT